MADQILVCRDSGVIKAACSSDSILTDSDNPVTLEEGVEKLIKCNGKDVFVRVENLSVFYRVGAGPSSQSESLVPDVGGVCKSEIF